jgi:ABC-type nitrate/sulfonate/bicarbonate transport system substrate-binding protein
VLLVALGVACASAAPAPQPAPAAPAAGPVAAPPSAAAPPGPAAVPVPEREHIRVMYGSVSGSMAPLWIADDKQLFKKYGLTVDVQYAETTIGASALVSGDAQFNINDGVSGFHAIAAGSPIRMVATFGTKNNYAIVVRPEITRPGDLRGKTIAVLRPGDTTDVSARIGLKPYGLRLGEDVQPLQVGNSPTRLSALLTGQVAAALLAEAFVDQAVAQGMRLLISLEKEDRPYLTTVVLMPTQFGRANPNTVQAFLKTMIEATKFYADPANRAEVLPLMARQLKLDASDPTVADAYEYFHVRLKRDPTPDRDGAEAILDALRGIDPAVYQTLTVDDVFDSSYMNTLVASGFVQAVYGPP